MDDAANESLVRRLHEAMNADEDARRRLHRARRLHNDAAEDAAATDEELAAEQYRGAMINMQQLLLLEIGMLKEDVQAIVHRLEVLEAALRASERAIGEGS